MSNKIFGGSMVVVAILAASVGGNIYASNFLEEQAELILAKAEEALPESRTLEYGDINASAWRGIVEVSDIKMMKGDQVVLSADIFIVGSSILNALNGEAPHSLELKKFATADGRENLKIDSLYIANQDFMEALLTNQVSPQTMLALKGSASASITGMTYKKRRDSFSLAHFTVETDLSDNMLRTVELKDLKFSESSDRSVFNLETLSASDFDYSAIRFMGEASLMGSSPDKRAVLAEYFKLPQPNATTKFKLSGLEFIEGRSKVFKLKDFGFVYDYSNYALSDFNFEGLEFKESSNNAQFNLDKFNISSLDLSIYKYIMEAMAADVEADSMGADFPTTSILRAFSDNDNIIDQMLNGMGMNDINIQGMSVTANGAEAFSLDTMRMDNIIRIKGTLLGGDFIIKDMRIGSVPPQMLQPFGLKHILLNMDSKGSYDDDSGRASNKLNLNMDEAFDLDMVYIMGIGDIDSYKGKYRNYFRQNFTQTMGSLTGVGSAESEMAALKMQLDQAKLYEDINIWLSLTDLGPIGKFIDLQAQQSGATGEQFRELMLSQMPMLLTSQFEADDVAKLMAILTAFVAPDSQPLQFGMKTTDDWHAQIDSIFAEDRQTMPKASDFIALYFEAE